MKENKTPPTQTYLQYSIFIPLLITLSTGCTFQKKATKSYSSFYYVVKKTTQYKMDIKNNRSQQIKASSLQKLTSKQTTIAFFPPDSCAKQTTQGYKSSRQKDFLRTRCGVMMSRLQNRAIRMGFNVFSWKQLGSRSIEFARKQKIDFLFIVNEFGQNQNKYGEQVSDRLTFHQTSTHPSKLEDREHRNLSSLAVPRSTGLRCHNYMKSKQPSIKGRTTVSLNVNMVDIKNGRVLWNYKRELGFDKKSSWKQVSMDAWLARKGGSITKTNWNKGASILTSMGVGFISIGSGLLLGGVALESGSSGFDLFGTLGGTMLVIGVGSLLPGLIWGLNTKPPKIDVPNIPSPKEVMCKKQGMGVGSNHQQKETQTAEEKGASFSFSSQSQARYDHSRAKVDKLMKKLVDNFFAQLKKS